MDWTEIAITVRQKMVTVQEILRKWWYRMVFILKIIPLGAGREIAHIDLIDEELLNKDRTKRYYTCIYQS